MAPVRRISLQGSSRLVCTELAKTKIKSRCPVGLWLLKERTWPRSYRRSDYLPCILWGRTAQALSQCATGDTIRLTGRLQSRLYRKATEEGVELRTAYEISALTAQREPDPLL